MPSILQKYLGSIDGYAALSRDFEIAASKADPAVLQPPSPVLDNSFKP